MATAKLTTTRLEFACLHCGASVIRWPSEVRNPAQVFCNRACRFAYMRAQTLAESLEDALWKRFWKFVRFPDTPEGCWLWQGAKDGYPGKQYGSWGFHRWSYKAHRMVYAYFYGFTRENSFICHTCDQPLCVKPQHLFEGDHQANMDDMWAKGRQGKRIRLWGEQNSQAKLTAASVLEIQKLYDEHTCTTAEIARRFCISRRHVRDIGRRRKWKHLENGFRDPG